MKLGLTIYSVWILFLLFYIGAHSYSLKLLQNPYGCRGGEVFDYQPIVSVLGSTGQIAVDYVGHAYVQIGSSPTGYESLYVGHDCDVNGNCGTKVTGSIASVPFVNGYAMFENLVIMTAGSYTLTIFGSSSSNVDFASVNTLSFQVTTGDMFMLSFLQYVGTATGGVSFSPNPAIAVVDRGGNTVSSVNTGSISAYLSTRPTSASSEVLQPPASTTVTISYGTASFAGLYINTAGYPYVIAFHANIAGYELPVLYSRAFDVAIGSSALLTFASGTTLSSSYIQAGEFIKISPRLEIRDAGGNLIATDSTSGIQISIYDNPAGSRLTPYESTFATATAGIVTFSTLSLDKQSKGYRLLFTLFKYSSGTGVFAATSVNLISEYFDVNFGPPRAISSRVEAGNAWAGGQAMGTQPVLKIVDYGDNILVNDYNSITSATVINSPGTFKKIRIDTTSSTLNYVTDVQIDHFSNNTFGTGEIFTFTVYFKYDIWIVSGSLTLALNVASTSRSHVYASLSGPIKRVPFLSFVYVVQDGDYCTNLDYTNTSALISHDGASVIDGNNNTVSLTLPSNGISSRVALGIDTKSPVIQNITCNTTNGEYSVGQVIQFVVSFDHEVIVTGVPVLYLNVSSGNHSVYTFERTIYVNTTTNSTGNGTSWAIQPVTQYMNVTIQIAIASYVGMDRSLKSLLFNYEVLPLQSSHFLTFSQHSIVLDFDPTVNATIKRLSQIPLTNANLSISPALALFESTYNISIDTSTPALDFDYGVRTSHANGTYYAGELFFLSVRFTKPIVVIGFQINLLMQSGNSHFSLEGYATLENLESDNQTVVFRYVAPLFSNTSRLDIFSEDSLIIFGTTTYIRRLSTHPLLDASLSTKNIYLSSSRSLRSTAAIGIDGNPATVLSVQMSYAHPFNTSVFYPDDWFLISVKFSGPVAFTCSPVLVMLAGYSENAIYYSGNQTDTLIFKYTVAIGDSGPYGLAYQYAPNALCSSSDCSATTTCGIYSNATELISKATLTLPTTGGSRTFGVPLNTSITIRPSSRNRNTTVKSISTSLDSGVYGSGTVIYFYVTFSDVVQLRSYSTYSTFPSLLLNIGKFASFAGGDATDTLKFLYVVADNDSIADLHPMALSGHDTAINCNITVHCQIRNRIYDPVVLNTSLVIQDTGIELDSNIPRILKIITPAKTSPYDGVYGVGEEIEVIVVFDRPVIVIGVPPQLAMDVGVTGRYAYYTSTYPGNYNLSFTFTVDTGDYSTNLMYLPGVIDNVGGKAKIMILSSIPTTEVNYSLPIQPNMTLNDQYINIDSIHTPYVTKVVGISPNGRYAVGDKLIFQLDFSNYVVATGRPYLHMNCGKSYRNTTFLGTFNYTGNAPTLPTSPSKSLYFSYEVQDSDFNNDFDYVDQFSLFSGVNDNGGKGWILQASSNPTTHVNLDLPVPGNNGSLSASSDYLIDGIAPYLVSLEFRNPAGTYGVGDEIVIYMNFSAPVVVMDGVPSILMETGSYKRPAPYSSGNGSSTLAFVYMAQPGDISAQLDYVADRLLLLSGSTSFLLNGARILAASVSPSQSAIIFFNPPGGYLSGTKSVTAIAGIFDFVDLSIFKRGPDYHLLFESAASNAFRTLTTENIVFVSFSNEFEVRPSEALPGDKIGFATSIYGNLAVLGAPGSNLSVTTIQTVTTKGLLTKPQPQIQVISTQIDPQPMIQSFFTTAAVGETLGGYFQISYGTHGTTRPIPTNVIPAMLEGILRFDLSVLKNVTVSREPYIFCACQNAFTWTLTFQDFTQGPTEKLTIDGSYLTGKNAEIKGPKLVQSAALLSGSFTLLGNQRQSRPVAFDADVSHMTTSIEDLGYSVINIQITPSSQSRTRSWLITFDAYQHSYDIPLLSSNSQGLTGGKSSVWHEMVRPGIHGPNGIAGEFAIEFRNNITTWMPSDVSASDMKAALEALPVINMVNVNRSSPTFLNEYTWTIEFVEIRHNTPRGYVVDSPGNVEPLVPHSRLIGTETSVEIGAIYGLQQPIHIYGAEREGSYGNQAGAAYIYQNVESNWVEAAQIRGNDTNTDDQFGSSVAIFKDLLLVGAPAADKRGLPEIQSLTCKANSGYFRLGFRGWYTDYISYNVSRQGLLDAIVSNPGQFSNLYSVSALEISTWGEDGFCSGSNGNTAFLTFLSPVDGAPNLFNGVDNHAALELLTLDTHNLSYIDPSSSIAENATLTISLVQLGTQRVHGNPSDVQQCGSAYLFQSITTCAANASVCIQKEWAQIAQFFPTNPKGGEKFGSSVALSASLAVVGAPGRNGDVGSVFVYQRSWSSTTSSYAWNYLQEITVGGTSTGDQIGFRVEISNNTIVFGVPQYLNASGTVFIFRRPATGGYFTLAQTITLPNKLGSLNPLDRFGFSVAISTHFLVIGSPGRDRPSLYLGLGPTPSPNSADNIDTGSVFVFYRSSELLDFSFFQELIPSNVRFGDQFGWDVAIDGSRILVSSLQNYQGAWLPSVPMITIRTQALYNDVRLGSAFALQWMAIANSTQPGYRSRAIPFDATAAQLRTILEEDFPTGSLSVSRSRVDQYDGGYEWSVTFLSWTANQGPLPLIVGDALMLTGTNASVIVTLIDPMPPNIRRVGHVFVQDGSSLSLFREEVFVSPYSHQPIDFCGYSVAIMGEYALLGCPNRDTSISHQNSGSGAIYFLDLLHIEFRTTTSAMTASVLEGDSLPLEINRRLFDGVEEVFSLDISFFLQTLDRNSNSTLQTYISNLYGISPSQLTYPNTYLDQTGLTGSAMARNQFYGSVDHPESVWVDGMYDYSAISDYVPLNVPLAFLTGALNISNKIITTGDTILEKPNENFTVILQAPGLWPSPLGKLFLRVTIVDNDNGYALSRQQFDKVYPSPAFPGLKIGDSFAISQDLQILVVGQALQPNKYGIEEGGIVEIYSTQESGTLKWILYGSPWTSPLASSSPQTISMTAPHFGEDVILSYSSTRNESFLIVSEPGNYAYHIYLSQDPSLGISYSLETTLLLTDLVSASFDIFQTSVTSVAHSVPFITDLSPQDFIGRPGSMAISGYLLAIGVPGQEVVLLFRRTYIGGDAILSTSWNWQLFQTLRSSDFDYDLMFTKVVLHHQFFGWSVSISERSIAIGSPFADYDNQGNSKLVEIDWDTQGPDMQRRARGRVYCWNSAPAEQIVRLQATQQLNRGTFRLVMNKEGKQETTNTISFLDDDLVIANKLEQLSFLDKVAVSSSSGPSTGGYEYRWTVTFLSEWDHLSLLIPQWNGTQNSGLNYSVGFNCSECEQFDFGWSPLADQIQVFYDVALATFVESQTLQADIPKFGDQFGYSVAIENDQIVVGSPFSSSTISTTWDFEAGNLVGWSASGTAFDYQPTYGDNSYYRMINTNPKTVAVPRRSQTSGMRGRYYIGTFEKRPGNPADYQIPDPNYPQGNVQGDSPRGSLVSQIFIIRGNTISFLVGGTEDIYTQYVELLVDGLVIDRVTGTGSEKMRPAWFNVSDFQQRAGQIRIVDGSSSGHINVDHISFDWDIQGAWIPASSVANGKAYNQGQIETPQSGLAYTFYRINSDGINPCGWSKSLCQWYLQSVLSPSDKRSGDWFGSWVALQDTAGVIAVGSPGSVGVGFYKEAPTVYPYMNTTSGASTAAGLSYPVGMANSSLFICPSSSAPLASSARGVWLLRNQLNISPNPSWKEEVGAVYVYRRSPQVLSSIGTIATKSHWNITEVAKIQSSQGLAGDHFGKRVHLSGATLAVGAPGQDGEGIDVGAVYVMNASFASLSFAQLEFRVLEGYDRVATVTIRRDLTIYSGSIVVEYATSDVTAVGIDSYKYAACMELPTSERGNAYCGDYELTRGYLVFEDGANSAGFTVAIVDDLCKEPYLKYIQVTISVPGGSAIQGETMTGRIRIDDNDFNQNTCDQFL